ncbi:MAG: hypothetical protein FWF18_05375 [Dehalococcoidia bacterium]|nr:hypothetical protein [Dehalococcoidia bacterium]
MGQLLIHRPTGCFVTRRLVPPAWIYAQVHPEGSPRRSEGLVEGRVIIRQDS